MIGQRLRARTTPRIGGADASGGGESKARTAADRKSLANPGVSAEPIATAARANADEFADAGATVFASERPDVLDPVTQLEVNRERRREAQERHDARTAMLYREDGRP